MLGSRKKTPVRNANGTDVVEVDDESGADDGAGAEVSHAAWDKHASTKVP